jgi:hypothetical protein
MQGLRRSPPPRLGAPGRGVPERARLRVVSGGLDEAVARRKQFEGAHPEIVITPPGTRNRLWTARRDGTTLASGYQLSFLLDTLGRMVAGPSGGIPA